MSQIPRDQSTGRHQSPAEVTRRDFLRRAGLAGAALTVVGPQLNDGLHAAPVLSGSAPTTLQPAAVDPFTGLSAPPPPGSYSGLRWRHLGPFRGGRVAAVSGVPGRTNEFYYGAVNGGVWKSIDGGRVWSPIFDEQPVASIGALAVAPTKPDTMYVGSGESTLRDSTGFGNGVYKSTDAGKTWTHLGLTDTHHIGRIAIDPKNPDIVFVAAIGKLYSASEERGVFRSTNGGKTWQRVLRPTTSVGAVDVVIDPSDSKVVYAALWATRRPPWFTYAPTNGPGGGLFKSTDGGSTWTPMTKGLPAEGIGRSGIAVCPSNPRRLYAVVDCLLPEPGGPAAAAPQVGVPAASGQGGVFRSDDAGASWRRLSSDSALWGRGWYFEKITVDPKNADIVYVPNVSVSRSTDGGATWVALRGSPGGDDYHQAWISPDDSDTMIVASDQGAIITRNARATDPTTVTWSSWLNQATAQVYHISVDHRFPYWVTGAQQDSGAVAVRSQGKFGQISTRDWEPIAPGGESGYTAGDPLHPGMVYGGNGSRWDLAQNAPVPGTTAPKGPEAERSDWTQPLVLSKADPRALYYANQYVFKSTDGARTWTRISDDLTRANAGIPPTLDATAAAQVDRNGKRGVVYTVAPSPLYVPMLWVGTDDGLIYLSTTDGKAWKDVTPPSVAPWSRVTMIDASYHDMNVAYATVDRHQLEDFEPYVFRTRDQGKTWQSITKGLPAGVYCHTIKTDRLRQGLLFVGTERGAYVSFDDGDNWQPLQLNLPVTSVRDFEVHGNDLVVGTHGRGIWVIDDISPLRQLTDQVVAADVYLFQPADAINMLQTGDNGTPLQKDEPQAPNSEHGAAIDYYLRRAPNGTVTLEILDVSGAVVRTFSSTAAPAAAGGRGGAAPGRIPNTSALWRVPPTPFAATAGMHRVVWNPVSAGGRRGPDGGGFAAPTELTGVFTARLTVDGQTQSRTFHVAPDPRSAELAR
ncbi:MAG: twin-arginine translocation signal domain-containing protein [Gemmatimonadaceae bacterium]|nr:twin-arginine translocation signal domain-containing protein [Gemmatimonadaceae bacterium]